MDFYQCERQTRNELMWWGWWWRLQSQWPTFVSVKPLDVNRQTSAHLQQCLWWQSRLFYVKHRISDEPVDITCLWPEFEETRVELLEGCQASDRSSKQHFNICKVWNYRILLTRHHSVTTFLNMATLDIFREASGQCLILSVATKPDIFAFFFFFVGISPVVFEATKRPGVLTKTRAGSFIWIFSFTWTTVFCA